MNEISSFETLLFYRRINDLYFSCTRSARLLTYEGIWRTLERIEDLSLKHYHE